MGPAIDVLFTTQPLEAMRRGAKAWIIDSAAQKFRSNNFFPSSMSTSNPGNMSVEPELLTRKSSFPPVILDTESAAAEMEAAETTSRVRTVTFGAEARDGEIFDGVRAVAKTWYPFDWNSEARALPIPPSEQPVIRTVLRVRAIGNWTLEMEEGRLAMS